MRPRVRRLTHVRERRGGQALRRSATVLVAAARAPGAP